MDKIHNFRRGKSGRKIEKLPYERSDGLFSTARKKLMRPAHSIKKRTTGKKPPMAGQKYICNHHRKAFSVVRTISQRIRQGYSAIADFGECAAAIRPRSVFFNRPDRTEAYPAGSSYPKPWQACRPTRCTVCQGYPPDGSPCRSRSGRTPRLPACSAPR